MKPTYPGVGFGKQREAPSNAYRMMVSDGPLKAVDAARWRELSPRAIRQIRSVRFKYKYVALPCPTCHEPLVIPLQFFTVKRDLTLVSDRKLICAEDSKRHAYAGGCGHTFNVRIPHA